MIEYTLTSDEFLRAIKQHWSKEKKETALIHMGIIVVLSVIAWVRTSTSLSFLIALFTGLLMYILLLIVVHFLVLRKYKKAFNNTALLHLPKHVQFNKSSFTIKTDLSDVTLHYGGLYAYHKTSEFLLIYLTKSSFHIIPLNKFDHEDEINTLLKKFALSIESRAIN